MKRLACTVLLLAISATAQVYSPVVLRKGQPDPTDLKRFAQGIYNQAGARTPREKAEAIWRYFLTDGRFVKPGFWYHIAGWTYEEPWGEVLDPVKLINSYGFGLCYHIAPLLEAMYDAGGFEDARVWFLTGHTVTEVFYDGAYHYFDSDMMGYNVRGLGPFRGKPVVGVRDLERDGSIFLDKLAGPREVKPGVVDNPWYPADVRAAAIPGLAELFTTTRDNYLYAYTRYSPGHEMNFTLRPGEKLIRYFHPEQPDLFYLPYTWDGKAWREFPKELAHYHIRTADGPHSQKDTRLWGTGRIEYTPPQVPAHGSITIDMPSPYVIIDALFSMRADLTAAADLLRVETSADGGATWERAAELHGPYHAAWHVEPKVLASTQHGRLTAVSGHYGYTVRIVRGGDEARISGLTLVSRIELNPRTLPALQPGRNPIDVTTSAPIERIPIPVQLPGLQENGFELCDENAQYVLKPRTGKSGEAIVKLSAAGKMLAGFDAGARFLDLRDGLAPDKLTAETRHTNVKTSEGPAELAWALKREGPYTPLWTWPQAPHWRDGEVITRLLRWPEVFRQVRDLPPGTTRVYVRFRSAGPALDNVRLAVYADAPPPRGELAITHVWTENGVRREHSESMAAGARSGHYSIVAGPNVKNEAIILQSR